MNNSHDNNSSLASAVKPTDDGILLFVKLTPGAKRSQIIGLMDDRLKIAVREKAVEGAANEALQKLLAETLGLAKGNVTLVHGKQSRAKTVLISGLNAARRQRVFDQLQELCR